MTRIWLLLPLVLAGCGSQPPRPVSDRSEAAPAVVTPAPVPQAKKPAAPTKFGGGYKDDGPGEGPTIDPDSVPDAVPRVEQLHRFANNPYSALGRDYVPLREIKPYKARGIASWYGKRYHGQRTSSGETYDMYAMTAAHPVLPIPSYARVSNPANGKSVVVRINDRGPFHAGREIDLSWTAAYKLGYLGNGSTVVEVESVLPGQAVAAAQATPPSAPTARAADDDPIAKIAAAEADPPLPEVQDVRGHYLQLGAFGNRDNAESLRTRLARELGDLAGKLVVQPAGKVYRVQLGPWPDAAAAQLASARLRESLGMAPVMVQR